MQILFRAAVPFSRTYGKTWRKRPAPTDDSKAYGKTWRYKFNHTKSGVVTFGETKPIHSQLMREREWMLGEFIVEELFEYKNLGVLKNYVNSFASNVDNNIEKTRKKAGMIFSSDFNRRKTNPLIYVKFWRQACLPSLLFGTELFTLNASQRIKLERCQQWFLKNIFMCPSLLPAHSYSNFLV